MTLKQMHIFFITLAVALTVVVAAWAIRAYLGPTGTGSHLGFAVLSLLVGTTLWTYKAACVRKAHRLGLR